MSRVGVIILAAGMSSRLGRPKQTLPLAGEALVAHVGRRAGESRAARIVAVVGAAREETMAALEDVVDEIVINPDFAEGQGTSIAAGVRHLQSTAHMLGACEAVVFLLGDQPGINPGAIDAVIAAWEQGAGIAMAQYLDHAGHPVLFDRAYWTKLLALEGDQGGKRVMNAHPDAVVHVPVEMNSPMDVDTEADWRTLQEWWAEQA